MLSLDDPLTLLKIDKVPGSGVLQFMHPGMSSRCTTRRG